MSASKAWGRPTGAPASETIEYDWLILFTSSSQYSYYDACIATTVSWRRFDKISQGEGLIMKISAQIPIVKTVFLGLCVALVALVAISPPALSAVKQLSNTDFRGFTTGTSVDGQGGWGIGFGSPSVTVDEEVTVDGEGNNVFRLSNEVISGSLGNMPFAPRPAGIPTYPGDTSTNPVLGQPGMFAGESSTTAQYRRFSASLDFRSATGAPQANLEVTVSADNGAGGRMSYANFTDSGTGINLVTFDVDAAGNFVGPQTIATGLSYTAWHNLAFEVDFYDGPSNDVVNIYLNGVLVHTGTSWEDYYRANDPGSYPLGVPVQTLVFTTGAVAVPGNRGGGYYFDNIVTKVVSGPPMTYVPTLSQWGQLLLVLSLMGVAAWCFRKRQSRVPWVRS